MIYNYIEIFDLIIICDIKCDKLNIIECDKLNSDLWKIIIIIKIIESGGERVKEDNCLLFVDCFYERLGGKVF